MIFTQTVYPQFRDADIDGLVGLKGCMRNFQDVHGSFMYHLCKGNDSIIEKYGAAWVYTRYHVSLYDKLDYAPAEARCVIEPYRHPVVADAVIELNQHGRAAAAARLQTCLISLERQRPVKFDAIEFPDDIAESPDFSVPAFLRPAASDENMSERYKKTVRASDLDKSGHMTNLKYIDMFIDGYDSSFWRAFGAKEMEISFITQCREGETLRIMSREEDSMVLLAAEHADGSIASFAVFTK